MEKMARFGFSASSSLIRWEGWFYFIIFILTKIVGTQVQKSADPF